MEPLKIGVSARLLYPDPSRTFLPSKSVQYLEQSVANWVMSGDVLTFMIPEMSLATPHVPNKITAKHYVDALDGLVLQGGEDMCPESYREDPINPMWGGDKIRDQYEIELFHEFVTQGKPVLGICRGHQVINVALGGSLYQDIPTQCEGKLAHRDRAKYEHHFHGVRILPGSWLAQLYPGDEFRTCNSIHHQAVKTLGEGLVVEALSEPDGMVEAIRWEGHCFVVGVQWHPEFMDPNNAQLVQSRPLLDAFVKACEHRKKTGKATPVMAAQAA